MYNSLFHYFQGYIINNATVKESNKEFDTYGHDCELVITRSTNVKKCNMPAKKLVFTPLEDLPSHVLDENISEYLSISFLNSSIIFSKQSQTLKMDSNMTCEFGSIITV